MASALSKIMQQLYLNAIYELQAPSPGSLPPQNSNKIRSDWDFFNFQRPCVEKYVRKKLRVVVVSNLHNLHVSHVWSSLSIRLRVRESSCDGNTKNKPTVFEIVKRNKFHIGEV